MGMAKKGTFRQRMRDLAAEYAYLVTLSSVIAVIVASAVYTQQIRERTQEALVQAAAGAPEIRQTPTAAPTATPLPTIAPLVVRTLLLEQRALWPVEGDVLRGHDLQEHVYWETLGAWKVHDGLDIAGKADAGVRCAAAGTVQRVTRDALWGGSVEIMQEDGRLVIYRGLALCFAEVGDALVRGQEIGTLMEAIPCEAELGAHLHLQLRREGRAQDPLTMLEER